MFESLKKKLKAWVGVPEKPVSAKKKEKPAKKSAKKEKKTTTAPKKAEKAKQQVAREQEQVVQEESIAQDPEITEEQQPEQKGGFFSRLAKRFTTTKITAEQVEETFGELELILLDNNVALEAVDAIKAELLKSLVGQDTKKDKIGPMVVAALKEAIRSLLQEPQDLLTQIQNKKGVFTIVFFGINGTGKTTSVAKLAHYLKSKGISSVLAAADTFRAASIEQIETHATRLNMKVVKQTYGADPAAVAFDAKKYAEANGIKCVLIDTAGRMYTKDNLLKEMEKIMRVAQPDLKLFVGEAIAGNDATEQARTFNEAVGIDGLILTKADVDEKGGASLSVSYVTKKPIYFLGMGQGYGDLKPFKKEEMLKNLGLD